MYNVFSKISHVFSTIFNLLLQPFITRRITKTSLEWRIRNLPYPESIYSVTAEPDGTMTVRTSNKKYFKKLRIPDLERIGLKPEQQRISFRHQYNTLIITVWKNASLYIPSISFIRYLSLILFLFFYFSIKSLLNFSMWRRKC